MDAGSRESFLAYYASVCRRTRAVAECVPEEGVEWSPGEGRFTPGDLLRHIAGAERWMWAENARCLPSRYPGHARDLAEGRAAVLEYLDRLQRETADILARLEDADWERRCETVGGIEMRVWKWMRLMVEHQIHHRGQLYEVLAAAGVRTPPIYGLTEPEVQERSL